MPLGLSIFLRLKKFFIDVGVKVFSQTQLNLKIRVDIIQIYLNFFFNYVGFDRTNWHLHGLVVSVFIFNVNWFDFLIKKKLINSILHIFFIKSIEPTVCWTLCINALKMGLQSLHGTLDKKTKLSFSRKGNCFYYCTRKLL